ncbi:MAG: UvrD-helicase domain-containing protein, partial [Clostridia bacterium]|nr:UvrD-helicase domain-containing protein [Clostridia bacterium]
MSENKNWTKDQLSAIEFGGKDILVCASAGSGKTTVLIERIIRSITDKDTCSDVRKMLVVTFTEAAAAQLKDKLSKAIKKAIRKYPKNKHLRRQLNELPRAHIATINSFCLNVVRNNFEQLGFGSNVRIADEAENKLIMADVMNSCIEEFYNNPSQLGITDFANFCDTFTSLSDSALAEIFLKLYDTLYSQLEGIDLLINNAAKLKEYQAKDPFENIWGTELKKRTGLFLDYFKEKYSEIFDIIAFDEGINKAYGNAVIADNNLLDAIWANLDNGYYAVRKYLLSYEMLALGRYSSKNGNPLDAAKVKNIRNEFKKQISKISELYLYGEKEILTATKETSEFNGKLYTFLSFFHKKVMDEKKRRGVVSFADCEALTLALLCENGEPTPAALKYQSMFDAVYIDEYQDVNSVQD